MSPEQRERVIRLVDALVDLPAGDRSAALGLLCGGPADGPVRAEVERALGGDARLDDRLAGLATTSSPTPPPVPVPPAGAGRVGLLDTPVPVAGVDDGPPVPTVVGRYHIRRRIEAGGMGEVFLAEQVTPIRREVALKLIRAGFDSHEVVARFDAERQALALMDHPNIARVLDAGSTDGGRPYFVMELVRGVPITTFCDARRLPPAARLGLFVQVCRAVQHAHTKGVIHRDLKPGNVLVEEVDGRPVPKVIDFGIAKAVARTTADRPAVTEPRDLIGTPAYMSPEQADDGGTDDVDTRSDVYSLGVLLYELLTGTTPFDPAELRAAGHTQVRRVIREVRPPPPSTRTGRRTGVRATVAAGRQPDAARLARLVRRDLDWVVMRCLEKDRANRYATADALARDVERYLADEPVEAGPATLDYRARAFARRHRRGLATAIGFGLLLTAGSVVSAWQAVRATAARNEARGERDAARLARAQSEAARAQAEEQRRAAETVADHLIDALGTPNPSQGPRQATMAVTLRRAAVRLDAEFAGDPLVKARLMEALGLTCGGLGLADQAADAHDKARAIRSKQLGPDHPDTLRAEGNLAAALRDQERHAQAATMFERVMAKQAAQLGPDHPDTLRTAFNLARTYLEAGRYPAALATHEAALARQSAALGADHPDVLRSAFGLARAYWTSGRVSKAGPLFEQVTAAMLAKLGPLHPDARHAASRLASLYQAQGRHAEAEPLIRTQLDPRPAISADTAAGYATALERLGLTLLAQGKFAPAEVPLREAVELRRKYQPADWERFGAEAALGRSLAGQGRDAEAEPLLAAGFRGMTDRGDKLPWIALARVREAREELVRLHGRRGGGRGSGPSAPATNPWHQAGVPAATVEQRIARATLAIQAKSGDAKAYLARGRQYARAGRFGTAADDFLTATRLDPAGHDAWYERACLLAHAGRTDEYAAHCKAMADRFGQSRDAATLDRTAKACLLLPGGSDPRAALAIADRAVRQAGDHEEQRAWANLTRALALYRCGDLPGATTSAAACTGGGLADVATRAIAADLIAALARARSDPAGGGPALARARRRIEADLPVAGVDDLFEANLGDWVLCRVLDREVEGVAASGPTE